MIIAGSQESNSNASSLIDRNNLNLSPDHQHHAKDARITDPRVGRSATERRGILAYRVIMYD